MPQGPVPWGAGPVLWGERGGVPPDCASRAALAGQKVRIPIPAEMGSPQIAAIVSCSLPDSQLGYIKPKKLKYWGYAMQDDYEFEWDPAKSATNLRKHGISFEDAKRMWDDPYLLEVHLTSEPENRWAALACVNRVHLTAIITYREDRVRIISARRSTKKEAEIYEQH